MKCINCGTKTKITNSRSFSRGYEKWRRHNCLKCETAFTTRELADLSSSINVVKNSGRIEPFVESKLLISVYKAIDHRPNAQKDASSITETVINKLLPVQGLSLTSLDIAQQTLVALKHFDPAGAVKYQASLTPGMNKRDIRRTIR